MNHGLLRQFRRYPSFFTSCAFHVLLVMRQWVSSHCRPRPTKREFLRRCLDFPPKVRINVSSPGNGCVYSATLRPSTLSARSISGTFVLKLWRHGGHGEPLHWLRLTAALRLFIAQNLHWTQSRRSQRRVERGQKADGQGGDRNPY